MSEQVRIYYGALGMWWRPDGCGYTYLRAEAGVYSREDAASRLSGDPARKERLIDADDPWDPLQTSRERTELLALREDVTALRSEATTLRDQCNTAEDALRTAGFTLVGGAWVKPTPDELRAWPSKDEPPPEGKWRYDYICGSVVGRFQVGVRGGIVFDAGSCGIYGAADFIPRERFVRVA